MISLAQNLANSESEALIAAVRNAIDYFNYGNTSDVNGMTIYFPYTDLSYFNSVVSMYQNIGMDDQYVQFISNFISVMLGGQSGYTEQNTPVESEDPYTEDWSSYDWYDEELVDSYEDDYQETAGDYYDLIVTEKNGGYVLSLTDEEWSTIVGIGLQVYLDDGEGYIYLGSDNVYEFDEDGDLMISFDNTWVSVNYQTVTFYAEEDTYTEDGFWYTYGSAPAYLNGEPVDIIIMWDDNNPYGYVVGARYYYEGTISQKGYVPLRTGTSSNLSATITCTTTAMTTGTSLTIPLRFYGAPQSAMRISDTATVWCTTCLPTSTETATGRSRSCSTIDP